MHSLCLQAAMLTSQLQELPHLLNSMPPPLLKTLSATNSTIRKVVHQHVQSITIFTPEDVVLLASADWPNMTSLDLEYNLLGDEIAWLTQDYSCLTSFKFEMKDTWRYSPIRRAVHSCVSPLLASSNWPMLCTLNLTWACLDDQAMAQMALGNWPNLTKLVLSGNLLNTAAIKHLVKGNWPLLETLDLSKNRLDASSTEMLAQGLWPKLKSLNISQMGVAPVNMNYNAASLASVPGHLVQGDWPLLECLILDMVNIGALGISVLIKGSWPLLKELSMCHNDFFSAWLPLLAKAAWPLVRKFSTTLWGLKCNADAISRLMSVGWRLEELVLHTDYLASGYLSGNAIPSLVKSDMTSLKCLDLTGYELEGGYAASLAESKWPQLVRLRLNICGLLDANTAGFLVKADWPLLKHLAVTGISISSISVLCKGSWPYLETLELTENDVHFGVMGAAELVKGDWPCHYQFELV